MQIRNFHHNPVLRQLLVSYIIRTYQQEAIIDDDHLMMEYHLLIRDNRLNDLFIEEKLNNYLNDGNEHRG
jgi:Mg2+/Co2+ transporter CorC